MHIAYFYQENPPPPPYLPTMRLTILCLLLLSLFAPLAGRAELSAVGLDESVSVLAIIDAEQERRIEIDQSELAFAEIFQAELEDFQSLACEQAGGYVYAGRGPPSGGDCGWGMISSPHFRDFIQTKGDEGFEAWGDLIQFASLRRQPHWLNRVARWRSERLELIQDGARVVIRKDGAEVAKITGGILKVKYPHYGGDIVCHPTKTTTVIGKWKDQVTGGGTSIPINSKISTSGPSPGGVNALSETPNPNWTPQQIWDNMNDPWLRDAAARGDVIRAVSDPTVSANLINEATGQITFFGREVELLTKPIGQGGLGYVYDAVNFVFKKS